MVKIAVVHLVLMVEILLLNRQVLYLQFPYVYTTSLIFKQACDCKAILDHVLPPPLPQAEVWELDQTFSLLTQWQREKKGLATWDYSSVTMINKVGSYC